jgi:two-component system NtrC family sensor kinase
MSSYNTLLILPDLETGALLERASTSLASSRFITVINWKTAWKALEDQPIDLVVVSQTMTSSPTGASPVQELFEKYPVLPVALLLDADARESQMVAAYRAGYFDSIQLPLSLEDLQALQERAATRRRRLERTISSATRRGTHALERRVSSLEALERVGRKVTSLLDLDSVLAAVVDAAVELTSAEEGSLLLLDEVSGELYMRASKNFQQEFASTFRLPVRNSLVGQVLREGKPLVIDEDTPQKIKTAYLVHTLIYVPITFHGRVIGVLEVDHRQTRKAFSGDALTLMMALADYAAIAIENARLYEHSEAERSKLETILRDIEESVIVVDHDRRILLMNHKACQAFEVEEQNVAGKRLKDIVSHQELLETLRDADEKVPSRVELTLKDGRVLNALLTPLPAIGLVLTMQDITHLKELDRIKSDFVHTVSHDLRSPLTAILGYIELFDRVGPVNEQQREFIHRVQLSVHSITALINDLLDLGRIEAGFDARKEVVPFSAIIHYAMDGVRPRAEEKNLVLKVHAPDVLPSVLGNPIRLRQMLNNLLNNSVKYTPSGGSVTLTAQAQAEQLVIQVNDTGPGIPPADQPYIFDKFYRASNIPMDIPGTGLGLAIVKSIVENHQGRVWVESTPGQGATFTILLPTLDAEL